ncbi:MAG TPA: hydroxymethylbilane synthase [Candidatus Saccharimonadales bacterium]|nr:hydroxymethylbilane synthase [Candidatus Saccharimonadales bacterium]
MRIGTRGSALALAQSEHVRASLPGGPGVHRLIIIKTMGDLNPGASLARIGGKGVFTKEIEDALLREEVDLAVHSLKDLPTDERPGLRIGALLTREDPRDALVSREGKTLEELRSGAVIGTSSLRRRSQVLARRPDLRVVDLRGNVPTRLTKLEEGDLDAIILAAAGLNRLGLSDRATQLLEDAVMLPAPGQGVLAIQIRAGDKATAAAIESLNDAIATAEALAERSLLEGLGGGCLVPVGARARVRDGALELHGYVGHPEGRPSLRVSTSGPMAQALDLGRALAISMLAQGARPILDEVRSMERFP